MSIDVDRDRQADLRAELSFLLQSLRDLDAERAVGDVDQPDYVTLRDGYTKRAADVLRQIEAGRAELPPKRSAPWSKRIAVLAAVIAVAALAGWLVARSSGQRLPGDEITGNGAPDDVAGRLTEARQLLGSDPVRAIDLYGEVLDARPDHAEAHAYRGWLFFVVSQEAEDEQQRELLDAARAELDAAIAADPQYADPHCFRAVVADAGDDPQTAREASDACLALDPPGEVRALMEPFAATLSPPSTTP